MQELLQQRSARKEVCRNVGDRIYKIPEKNKLWDCFCESLEMIILLLCSYDWGKRERGREGVALNEPFFCYFGADFILVEIMLLTIYRTSNDTI